MQKKNHPLNDLRIVGAIAVAAGVLLAVPRIIQQATTGHPELAVAHFVSGVISGLFCLLIVWIAKRFMWR
jgi:hypothetical protein